MIELQSEIRLNILLVEKANLDTIKYSAWRI